MGRCYACGCSEQERCVLGTKMATRGQPPRDPARRYEKTVVVRSCRLHRAPGGWLCTRCVRPDRMTTAQLGEAQRILDRKCIPRADVQVLLGQAAGELVLYAGPAICVPLRP